MSRAKLKDMNEVYLTVLDLTCSAGTSKKVAQWEIRRGFCPLCCSCTTFGFLWMERNPPPTLKGHGTSRKLPSQVGHQRPPHLPRKFPPHKDISFCAINVPSARNVESIFFLFFIYFLFISIAVISRPVKVTGVECAEDLRDKLLMSDVP